MRKEAHFFDELAIRGDDLKYFEASFRLVLKHKWTDWMKKRFRNPVVLESSPSYLRLPYVPCRIKKLWPGVKLVMLLRHVLGSGVMRIGC